MENQDKNTSRSFIDWVKNKYVIIIVAFLVWMIFFDMNSVLVHRKLDKELNEINHKIDYYSEKYKQDSVNYYTLKYSREAREKFARENYFMKRKNEDIFIVVHAKDTIQ